MEDMKMTGLNNSTGAVRCCDASKVKVALYCRAATQNKPAIDRQKEQLARFVAQLGYTDYVWYIDIGESGFALDRPELNLLREDIVSGQVDMVVTVTTDRIAYGFYALMKWMRLMDSYGVKCFSVDSREHG
jgi:DNA invertase Pin-like site-specific DNA recombinase